MSTASNHETRIAIPNGWFAVSFSKDLAEGEVKRVHCFGEELVLFRTREGEPQLLNAHCPHLGAHLAEGGKVVGDTIRCPFHQWQFDGTGQCVKIPYSKTGKIPRRAKLRSWAVVERNKLILAWHHAEGKPPEWEVPEAPEFNDPAWTDPRYFELEVQVHIQDMAENNCDPVHFHYVHSAEQIPKSVHTYADDGRYYEAVSEAERDTAMGRFKVRLIRETWGLGLSSVRLADIPNAGLYMFSSTSPVDATKSVSRWAFTVTRNMADIMGDEFIDNLSKGVLEDMRIWENKIHRPDPVLCDADDFLAEFRQWSKQFYSEQSV